jgi:hypothetical protein
MDTIWMNIDEKQESNGTVAYGFCADLGGLQAQCDIIC